MTTATLTLETIATSLNISVEDVAIRTASTYRRHIAINGSSFCGQINNNGISLATEYEAFEGFTCGICAKRYASKAGN